MLTGKTPDQIAMAWQAYMQGILLGQIDPAVTPFTKTGGFNGR